MKLQRKVTTFYKTRDEMRAAAKAGLGKAVDKGCWSNKGQRWSTVKVLLNEEAIEMFHDRVVMRSKVKTSATRTAKHNWFAPGDDHTIEVIIKRKRM